MFYQNVFDSQFIGVLVLADRQLSLNFKVPANTNSSHEMMAFNQEPYNLTGNVTLTLNYSFNSGLSYTVLAVNVTTTAANVAAVKAHEIASALNANATFKELFTASVTSDRSLTNWLVIKSGRPKGGKWKSYISNTSAESIIRFNKKAGVAELPTYFSRHLISNASTYDDSVGMLIQLSSPVAGVDVAIVTDAGLNPSIVQADYQLLRGRSGLFTFQKITVDGTDRITQIIEYPAGAVVGGFARKISYEYSANNTHPSTITEIPYTLASGDLVVPP